MSPFILNSCVRFFVRRAGELCNGPMYGGAVGNARGQQHGARGFGGRSASVGGVRNSGGTSAAPGRDGGHGPEGLVRGRRGWRSAQEPAWRARAPEATGAQVETRRAVAGEGDVVEYSARRVEEEVEGREGGDARVRPLSRTLGVFIRSFQQRNSRPRRS